MPNTKKYVSNIQKDIHPMICHACKKEWCRRHKMHCVAGGVGRFSVIFCDFLQQSGFRTSLSYAFCMETMLCIPAYHMGIGGGNTCISTKNLACTWQ